MKVKIKGRKDLKKLRAALNQIVDDMERFGITHAARAAFSGRRNTAFSMPETNATKHEHPRPKPSNNDEPPRPAAPIMSVSSSKSASRSVAGGHRNTKPRKAADRP